MPKIKFNNKFAIIFFLINIFSISGVFTTELEKCIQCHSSNDPKCATNPEVFLYKNCFNRTSECYVRIQDGSTIRGCTEELNEVTFNNCYNIRECIKCSAYDGCNNQVFPLHRISCLQCSGNSMNSSCATNPNEMSLSKVCPIYSLDDGCYIRKDNTNKSDSFQRGCLSSAFAQGLCTHSSDCYTCRSSKCNSLPGDSMQIPLVYNAAITLKPFYIILILCCLSIYGKAF